MVFVDRSFLHVYDANQGLPRGATTCLQQRVMISDLFTLNPFTLERMPLHFSDWFHFGLLADIRTLWDVPPISYRDSIHYRVNPHDPNSNDLERLFYTRLAVEQHLAYAAFKPRLPALTVDYHNDPTSAELACRILVDNFVVCDVAATKLFFEKYDHAKQDLEMPVKCITFADWAALARAPELACATFFAGKIAAAQTMLAARQKVPVGPGRRVLRLLGLA